MRRRLESYAGAMALPFSGSALAVLSGRPWDHFRLELPLALRLVLSIVAYRLTSEGPDVRIAQRIRGRRRSA